MSCLPELRHGHSVAAVSLLCHPLMHCDDAQMGQPAHLQLSLLGFDRMDLGLQVRHLLLQSLPGPWPGAGAGWRAPVAGGMPVHL